MDFQKVDQASKIIAVPPPPVNIHVMVVDDDATSLSVLSSFLKSLKYQVASFNDPIRAFHTLRAGKQSFDLIMTALYMSKMDGFELTKRVNDEFKLPVIMISSDDRESVMYRAIQEGVVLYLLKPFSPNDLRNIWQFAIARKTRSKPHPSLLIEETKSCGGVEFRAINDAAVHSVSSSNELSIPEKKKKNSKLGKGGNQEKANKDKKGLTSSKRKAKVVWTDFLQYRFLQAVHYIGLDRAVPKKILEVMNVPGLTRENVASHLQKYRIFLRKVAERCMITSDKKTEEILWSKFLSRHVSLVLQKIQQKRTLQLNSSQNPNIPPFSTPNNGDSRSKRRPSSSFAANLLPYGLGRTASLGNFVCPLPMNQNNNNNNNAQGFNFYGGQFHNLQPFEDYSYLGSSFSGNSYDYYSGFAGGISGEIPMAQQGISSNGFGEYGTGFGEDNSYNGGLMCNNGVNFGGDSQITAKHSSHDLVNKQQGFMKDHNHQLHNMSTANEEGPTTDPFPIDDQVLDEFLASLLRNNN